ncbi:hypothetical protein SAMN05428974_2171 [Sphingopyxis sp. YR583]|jgi:hypothetical protein|uniref:hypothetical protein n=1 Tax=Sphingopyxis sp. YR583 TaxID=1881047 RepID=UPI0008A7DA8F|nr:hypothetical protein [Sphingopyxis sp. YR583]SEH17338.1 hypothetical protein SAMN05428974_2171 [Sphingopyxis sp. YR583]
MKALYLAGAAALTSILACSAPTAAANPLVLNDISWVAESAGGKKGAPRVRIQHRKSSSDQSLDGSRPYFTPAEAALGRTTQGPVSFTVMHDAGTLSCTGILNRAFEGRGECRFTSDPAFEHALSERGLSPDHRSTLLAMLLVDATIELADGLTNEGVRPKDADDLIAAAALDVRPEYVRDLKSEALVLTDVEDAIACKALGVDGAYVRGLAAAGYRKLSADEVVGMKAMGVTGEYAQAMNRATGGLSK